MKLPWNQIQDQEAYLYGIRPKDGPYFYIGSTVWNVQNRLKQHLAEVRTGIHCNWHFNLAVVTYKFEVEIDCIGVVPADERFDFEYPLMRYVESQGIKLTNVVRRGSSPKPNPINKIRKVSIWKRLKEQGFTGSQDRFLMHAGWMILKLRHSPVMQKSLIDFEHTLFEHIRKFPKYYSTRAKEGLNNCILAHLENPVPYVPYGSQM